MHVDDLADAIWFIIQNPPNDNLINVGCGLEISIRDFAYKMAEVIGYRGKIEFDNSMPDGTPRKLLDSSKLSKMGWRPKISLSEGLESTYNWFTTNIELGMVRGYVQ
jgi:GDP-L-fucose synthase